MIWTCDEKNKNSCRNPFGCHCREIESLVVQRDNATRALRGKDDAMGVLFKRLEKAGVDCSDLIS